MVWVTLGQIAAATGGLVGVRILTGLLSPETYGQLALGVTLGTLGQLVAWSPIASAILRYFSAAQETSQVAAYLVAVRRLVLRATVAILSLGAVLVLGLVALGSGRWVPLAVAALLFTLLSGYESSFDNMQLAKRHRRVVAWHQGMSTWLRFLFAAALISLIGPSSAVAVFGYVCGVLLVLVSQLFFFSRKILSLRGGGPPPASTVVSPTLARLTQYAWPIAAWGVFSWVQAVSDRWILQAFTSTSVVGVYMALYQIGFYPMTLISTVTLQLVTPVIFERAGDGTDARRLDGAWRLVLVALACTIVLSGVISFGAWLFHGPLFDVLVGPRYRSASHLLPWMVAAGGLFAVGQAASQAVLMEGTRRLLAPKALVAVVTLGMYAAGAALDGLDGIVYANTLFGALYCVWMMHLAREWRGRVREPSVVVSTPVKLA